MNAAHARLETLLAQDRAHWVRGMLNYTCSDVDLLVSRLERAIGNAAASHRSCQEKP